MPSQRKIPAPRRIDHAALLLARVPVRRGPRRALYAGLIFALLVPAATGCRSSPLPRDIEELYRSARNAEQEERHADAILFYSDILSKHPGLAEVLLSRGALFMNLARRQPAAERRPHFERALQDFDKASESARAQRRLRTVANLQRVIASVELGQGAAAQELLATTLARGELEPRERASSQRLLGSLQLAELRQEMGLETVIPARSADWLQRCRAARQSFGEALVFDPRDAEALYGKGLCLYHEQLFQESEHHLRAALAAGHARTPGLLFILGMALEHRLGTNEESQRLYLDALTLDAPRRDFSPLYRKLYALLENRSLDAVGNVEPLRQLLAYQGQELDVWQAADRYFARATDDAAPGLLRLGQAVARARLGDAPEAAGAFRAWALAGAHGFEPAAGLTLVFGTAPLPVPANTGGGALQAFRSAELAIEGARASTFLHPHDPHQRGAARTVLENVVRQLEAAPAARTRDRLLAAASALLADELLTLVEAEPGSAQRAARLQRAEALTLVERRLADNHFAIYRQGRIEQLLRDDAEYPLEAALRAARLDPARSFRPVFAVLEQAVDQRRRQLAGMTHAMDEQVHGEVAEIEQQLQAYPGNDPVLREAALWLLNEAGSAPREPEATYLRGALRELVLKRSLLESDETPPPLGEAFEGLQQLEDELLRYQGSDLELAAQVTLIRTARRWQERANQVLVRLAQAALAPPAQPTPFGDPPGVERPGPDATIACPECGRRTARTATVCPSCGWPLRTPDE